MSPDTDPSQFSVIMILWICWILVHSGDIPSPLKWTGYDKATHLLSFAWEPYPDFAVTVQYEVSYTDLSITTTFDPTETLTGSIDCGNSDGRTLSV